MPGYKTHIAASLLFCGGLYFFPFWQPLPIPGKAACVAICVFFGLWPDVDTKSKGQMVFLFLFLIVDTILILRQEFERAAYLGMLITLPLLTRHRGWTHQWLAMVLIPGGLYFAAVQMTGAPPGDLLPYLLAALLGYASHLVIDKF
ncbi:metal-dependent hydrolase [bacterium]|nr:metal-dependent hydrolase [bacterium]